jgi:hypothetical protein
VAALSLAAGGVYVGPAVARASTAAGSGSGATPTFDVVAGTRVNLPCQVDTPPQPDPNVGLAPGQKVVSLRYAGTLWHTVGAGDWEQLATNAPVSGGPGESPCGWPPYTATYPGIYQVRIDPTQSTAEGDAPPGSAPDVWALDTSYTSEDLPEKVVRQFRVVARCEDPKLNGIKSVTDSSGHRLSDDERMLAGLAGDALGEGQTIAAPAGHGIELELNDGSRLRLGPGSATTYSCSTRAKERIDHVRAVLRPAFVLGKVWSLVVDVLGGNEINYEGPSDAAGVRGTRYGVTWLPSERRTTLHVYRGKVAFYNKHGRRHVVLLQAGQTAVQVANHPPRIRGRPNR